MNGEQFSIRVYVFLVFVSLISACMGYDQASLFSQPAHQFEGIFDPFALERTRRLEKEIFIGINSQVRAQRRGVFIWWSRRVVVVHHIRDNRDVDPASLAHFGGGQ